jgi:hypothetical protein
MRVEHPAVTADTVVEIVTVFGDELDTTNCRVCGFPAYGFEPSDEVGVGVGFATPLLTPLRHSRYHWFRYEVIVWILELAKEVGGEDPKLARMIPSGTC